MAEEDAGSYVDYGLSDLFGGQGVKHKKKAGKKIKGRGLKAGYKPPEVDYNSGVVPSNAYIPFGRYIIHRRQLDDDIVSIKYPSGSNVRGLVSTKVSPECGRVFRRLTGNGIPTFEEVSVFCFYIYSLAA